jgi:hypothetical protein
MAERQLTVGVRSVQVELAGMVERGLVPAGRRQPQEKSGPSGRWTPASVIGRVVTRRQTATEGS